MKELAMNSRKPGRGSRKSRSFQPRLETLEPRLCLSVSLPSAGKSLKPAAAAPIEAVAISGNTLLVNDNVAGDTITVADNGSGGVTATISNPANSAVATANGTGITNIEVKATGGDETVDYSLTPTAPATSAPLTEAESLNLNFGKGSGNTASLDFSQGITGGKLRLDVAGTGGENKVTETFGVISSSDVSNHTQLGGGMNAVTETFGAITSSDVSNHVSAGGGMNTVSESFGAISSSNIANHTKLGGGMNSVSETFGAISSSNVANRTSARGGMNSVNESFGSLSSAKVLNSTLVGGGQNTLAASIGSTATPANLAASDLVFNVLGTGGENTLSLTANANLDAQSHLDANLSGGLRGHGPFGHITGAGGDNVSFNYAGVDDGTLGLSLSGKGGGETLAANVSIGPGSTGSLFGAVSVPKQRDTAVSNDLTFDIADNSATPSSLAKLDATIYDSNAGDTIASTSNVNVVTKPRWWM
jgi:hypothetical protein